MTGVAGVGDRTGEYGAVGGCSFDHPEGVGVAFGAFAGPGDGSFDAVAGGGEITGFEVFTGVTDDGVDMFFRVRVHADDV